jgi:predicted RNase H-like HicB family nuclease
MKYHFKIQKEGDSFWANCLELEGGFTQGENLEELHSNMQDPLNLFIRDSPDNIKCVSDQVIESG